MTDHNAERLEILPIVGIGELRPGNDLAAAIVAAATLQNGDVLVVTSKAVSKVEGRLLSVDTDDPAAREALRQKAIESETARVVARRGRLQIVQTHWGLVMATAGVDQSNVDTDEIALLPVDPDASAVRLRAEVGRLAGVDVAVVITDSMGRPWRAGIVDFAIGVAGLTAVTDARGQVDRFGNELRVTQVAVADELAAAGDLVKGKLAGVPVAIVRGYTGPADDGAGSRELIRGADGDLFRLGTAEAIALGRADASSAAEPASALHADAVMVLGEIAETTTDEAVRALAQGFLGLLAARSDAVFRSCVPGHVTASALVVDPVGQRVLLTLHPRVGEWLQLGGHCEPSDPTVRDAALREAREESGIDALTIDPVPIDIDVHAVTCSLGVPTRHYDVRYLVVAPADAQEVRSDESDDLRWFDWSALPEGTSPTVARMIDAARERLGS